MDLFTLGKFLNIKVSENKIISNIVTSTKDIIGDCVLISLKGNNYEPEKLLTEKDILKCALILSNNPLTNYTYIPNLKEKVFSILDYFNFNFQHKFKIIGVTGTEGKSSLCDLIYQSLSLNKKKCLLISREKNHKNVFLTKLTTPSSYEFILAMKKANLDNYEYLICEVSSISICEHRIDKQIFDYLFLTNLNEDHLDYHKNLLDYHLSKINLFLENKKAIKYILYATFKQYENLFSKVNNLIIIKEDEMKILKNKIDYQIIKYQNKKYILHLGFYQNALNLLFLLNLIYTLNLDLKSYKLKRIPGRTDIIYKYPDILIDYAHSPKSMENLLKQIKKFKYRKVVLLFGAGGNREIEKRKQYGLIALKYADKIIVTNDNPRFEDPLKIAKDISQNNKAFKIILDRKKALKKAIKLLNKDDILIVLGKGNEAHQEIKNNIIPFNDKKIILDILNDIDL